ncbi:MAG: alpha/beta hydrolase [Gemmatimonadetes bacterium]|nr:alpha/beta hydrolase [Gemmatimonadota bacterium]
MAARRRTRRVTLIGLSVALGSVLLGLGILFMLSPGRPEPLRDADGRVIAGSISEKIYVEINGVRQGMFIKSRDPSNPVLLFVHGGTGMPEYFLNRQYPTGFEDYMTVVWWDRRGAGLSYDATAAEETLTIEQYIADTRAVTNYLRTRFRKDKIYLMAHSGGSIIGIQAVAQAPALYHAYIGVGQMTYQLKSELLAFEYLVGRYREAGNDRMVRQLEASPPTMTVPLPAGYMRLRDKAMHELGVGTTRDMRSVMRGVFLASWLTPDYTVTEKLNIWRGKFASDARLWDTVIAIDLTRQTTALAVPTYFFHGIHDYTVSYAETRAFAGMLAAPVKGFYTFNESAHSPMFEEPARVRRIMVQDVLIGTNALSDKP